MIFPMIIADVVGTASYRQESIGMSGASVLLFDDYVLKVRPEGGMDTGDAEVLRWMQGKLPVPEVAAHSVQDGMDWLLMTRLHGKMLSDASAICCWMSGLGMDENRLNIRIEKRHRR